MKTCDDLLTAIRSHIPGDAPPLEGYVTGYYFRCDCHRTEKHIRFRTDGWWQQRERRRRIPVLDAEGLEIDRVPSPNRQEKEPLAHPLPDLREVRAHPKPWLGPHQDDEGESGEEGDYCWECARKLRDQVFSRLPKGSKICNCIVEADSASGCCAVCGKTLEGEPEDLGQELQHWADYPPEEVSEWQQLERLVDKFDWELTNEKKGMDLLEEFWRIVQVGEDLIHQKGQSLPLALTPNRPIYQRKWQPVVHDPLAIREQFARKYYHDSLRELPEKRSRGPYHQEVIEHGQRSRARHQVQIARCTHLWQCLLQELGPMVARRWVDELGTSAESLEVQAQEYDEKNQQRPWDGYLEWAARDRAQAVTVRARALALEGWIMEVMHDLR